MMSTNGAATLTPKQERFIEEYVADPNATQAAIKAGYSRKTARWIGSENLTKPYIAAAIAKAQVALVERTQVTQDAVIADLVAVVKEAREATPPQLGAAVSALTRIGQHIGMWPKDAPSGAEDVGRAVLEALRAVAARSMTSPVVLEAEAVSPSARVQDLTGGRG